jgi:WD40 repeat protein
MGRFSGRPPADRKRRRQRTRPRTRCDHTNPVTGVAFGTINNQTILATAGYDNTVRLWDPATGEGANLASRLRARFRRRGR